MAETNVPKDAKPGAGEGKTPSDAQIADVGQPYPEAVRQLAENQADTDAVLRAHREVFLADSAQAEARAKVKVVKESPDADETPSGHALKKVAGVSNDVERGEKYAYEKTARRWGYVPVDE